MILALAVCSLLMYEMGTSLSRDMRRRNEYQRADIEAKRLGLELVVVGDPFQGGWNSMFGPSYGCGDVCLDLTGCPRCKGGSKEPLLNFFRRQSTHRIVIFESCVLESIPSGERRRIQSQMNRAAASLHQVRIGRTFIMRYLYLPRLWTGEPKMQSDW